MLFMKIEPRYSVGPGAALVDHRAGVGVAAARRRSDRPLPRVRVGADVVAVVGDRLDVVVGVRVEVRPGLPLVPAALDHVVEVRDHAGGEEGLAVLVEVDAPGVARAVGEDLELVLRRVIAPDPGVDRDAVLVGRAGLADLRVGEDAVAAVEPAVGAPGERVQGLVRVLRSPSRRAGPAAGRRAGRRRPCRG